MLEDTIASVRCPVCGTSMEGWMMKWNSRDERSLVEHYHCPCGCRFGVEVNVECSTSGNLA